VIRRLNMPLPAMNTTAHMRTSLHTVSDYDQQHSLVCPQRQRVQHTTMHISDNTNGNGQSRRAPERAGCGRRCPR
jgi:hypothetical protein